MPPLSFHSPLSLRETLSAISRADRSAEIYEGVGASCIIAVCAGLLLTRGIGHRRRTYVWKARAAAKASKGEKTQ
jgi:hypothetical protein